MVKTKQHAIRVVISSRDSINCIVFQCVEFLSSVGLTAFNANEKWLTSRVVGLWSHVFNAGTTANQFRGYVVPAIQPGNGKITFSLGGFLFTWTWVKIWCLENINVYQKYSNHWYQCQLRKRHVMNLPFNSVLGMMTSSNGNISALLGHCEGNPPVTKASDAELCCFQLSSPEQTVEHTIETSVI